jgi:hypothetical protein
MYELHSLLNSQFVECGPSQVAVWNENPVLSYPEKANNLGCCYTE